MATAGAGATAAGPAAPASGVASPFTTSAGGHLRPRELALCAVGVRRARAVQDERNLHTQGVHVGLELAGFVIALESDRLLLVCLGSL